MPESADQHGRRAVGWAGQATEMSRHRWLATEPGSGRTWTTPSVPLMGDVEDYEVGLGDLAGAGLIVPDGMGAGGRTVAPDWPPV
jgi:hypothetical protein